MITYCNKDDECIGEAINCISKFQSIGLEGANQLDVEGFLDAFSSSNGEGDFVVIRLSIERLLAQFNTGGVSATGCFFAKLVGKIDAKTGLRCDEKFLQAQKLYEEPMQQFTHVLRLCRRELKLCFLLVLEGYEHLLELPRKERQDVVGGPLFELCENGHNYNAALVLVSRCPIWWCEYDEPPFSSVIYERVAKYRIGDVPLLTPEEMVSHLPVEQRINFMRIARMRTNA